MVPLGIGQAILGGRSDEEYQAKIYYITCFQQMCTVSTLSKELPTPKASFVAIPMPDTLSGCISESKWAYFPT